MFEDSHNTDFDLLMKSILESGQEEVPERVWGGISEELDNLARRKKAALWWRRAAIGSAAADGCGCRDVPRLQRPPRHIRMTAL